MIRNAFDIVRRRAWVAACVLALACPPCGAATEPRLRLPQDIGPLEYTGEHGDGDARSVGSYIYRAAGLSLELDIDEYAPLELRDGSSSAQIRQTLRRLTRHFRQALHAELVRETTVPLGERSFLTAHEAQFDVAHAALSLTRSYVWLVARAGRLYTARLDVMRGFEEEGAASRAEVLAALGDALAQPLQEAEGAPPRVGVSILWDPATPESERRLWTVYLYTRAAQAARESGEQELAPGERQASFEEELRARRVSLGAFREMAPADAGQVSSYFQDLDRVESAGYLREYVWRYLHKPDWHELPPDLRLTAFDEWRSQHLRDHIAVTHGGIALRAIG
jgi:hypothetical protein